MKYPKEFKAIIDSTTENYIGHGNPNAKILFIGQEPAIDCKNNGTQYKLEIADNAEQWRNIIANGIGYDSIDPSKIEYGSPLHPWANQKFQVRTGSEEAGNLKGEKGTARTWFNYQKLINRIFELISAERNPLTKDDNIDFHYLSFHSDMSAVASKKHNHDKKEDASKSVLERVSLLSSDFFRNFPIVIAAVGHFPRDVYKTSGNSKPYFEEVFEVDSFDTIKEGNLWVNFNYKLNGNAKLLVHCPQFSASISNAFIDKIAKRVVDFANEHLINLMPEE